MYIILMGQQGLRKATQVCACIPVDAYKEDVEA
jgi:hypothetical protein